MGISTLVCPKIIGFLIPSGAAVEVFNKGELIVRTNEIRFRGRIISTLTKFVGSIY